MAGQKITLKRAGFLKGMEEPHIAKLSVLGSRVRFAEDQLILAAGERSTHFYILLSGSACVEVRTPVYTVCIQVISPGDACGWSSLLYRQDTLFQVRAREACTGFCWDGAQLFSACREDREFGLAFYWRLLELVAGRVKATESKLAEFCGAMPITRPL
ncbi:MAG TPA: cyclic nucleotide-binding domain-containing protein [Bryobacteraceae bacterium]|nr:cyclic nucleotide-binding domain-containing protein [Bryobacteraceae bacterium]